MKIKTLSRGQVRSLLKLQNGRCAISGKKIHPSMVSIDHIYPVSRSKEFGDKKGFGKYYGRVTKTGGAILLITGVLITTNQIQIISYYILTTFPFLTNFG